MFKLNKSLAAIAVTAALGMSSAAFASNTDGVLKGVVVDGNSTVVSGATVTIKNASTGFTRTVVADADGSYRFPALPIGNYTITTKKAGYDAETVENISVRIGETSVKNTMFATGVERIAVTGRVISMVDVSSSESALNIDSVELERVPVPRDVTSVALLAPGTTRGDSRFGGASFGGASVAENSTYINGLNVTNFRNGLGFSNVPYEFYDQFQVKTGGYSAEFGRSTGGVINAVVKSGTNEFKAGGSVYFQPEGLRENSPSVLANDGTYMSYRDDNSRSSLNANIWASGAIIEDTLFYYAIYNPKDIESETNSYKTGGSRFESQADDAFWGAKIDWNISDNHRLEFLAFSDESTYASDAYKQQGETEVYNSTAFENSGGDNWSVKYIGYLTDDLTMSVLYGENSYDVTNSSTTGATCELILDYRHYDGQDGDVPIENLYTGCATTANYNIEIGDDTREAFRVDFEWLLGDDHTLRFGMDNETNSSYSQQAYSGPNGSYSLIYKGSDIVGTPAGEDAIMIRTRTVEGTFETEASAFYIEDTWLISDTLTAKIGLRNEVFDNKNGSGNTFVKIDDMIAPRLGLSWDINGDGESKVFANWGRYYLPVANNTNIRLSGNEADVRNYYVLDGLTEQSFNGNTYWNAEFGSPFRTQVNADGSEPDTRSIVDADLDPMFQDEFILGYEAMINDDWSYGVKYTNRVMDGAIDDMIIDHAYDCGVDETGGVYHPGQYVLGNPGEEMTVFGDTDCSIGDNGKFDYSVDGYMTFSAEDLVYAKAERKYDALDFSVSKAWDGDWSLRATYTWSRSRGNAEGLVKSDNGQRDAGLTTDWDFPELMDGAEGYLPNDRRHNFKVYGTVAITEELTAGFNFNLESGRPQSAFGLGHPNVGEVDYGSTYYLTTNTGTKEDPVYEYSFVPRGSMGRLPWQARLDLNLMYKTQISGLDTTFKVDVFNALNADAYTRVDEDAESNFAVINDRTFGRPLSFQTPRYVQFSASVRF